MKLNCHASPMRDARLRCDSECKHKRPALPGLHSSLRSIRSAHDGSALLDIDLRLFDGAAAPSGGEAPSGEGAAIEGTAQGEGSAGKSGTTTASDTPEAKRQAYRELIEGEYREQYIEDTQRIVKEVEQLRQRQRQERESAQLRQNQRNLNRLYQEADHVRALYPEFDFRAQLKDQAFVNLLLGKVPMQRAYEAMREVPGVKELYPGFEVGAEAADRNFISMLKAGVPVKLAYEVKHMDEITAAAARNAAQSAGEQMTARMRSKSARPAENGTSSQSAVIVKSDVSKLTRKDRAEIARRVARGEQISF